MDNGAEGKVQVCYASLAIYSGQQIKEVLSQALQVSPSLVGEKRGCFSWIYSTQDDLKSERIEDHLEALRSRFACHTDQLIRFVQEGCEVRVWIYYGVGEVNGSFVLDPSLIAWLSSFSADICVDVWS
jgi:hypothetical protein